MGLNGWIHDKLFFLSIIDEKAIPSLNAMPQPIFKRMFH